MIEETETIKFISRDEILKNKKPTYVKINCDFHPQKEDPYWVRITVGGNLVTYTGDKTTPASNITIIKSLWNSVISTNGAKYATLDIKDFYLCLKLKNYEYIFIELALLLEEVIQKYDLRNKAYKGKVYAEVQKGMYGLPQAGLIAYNDLKQHLKPYGYYLSKIIPGLWHHKTSNLKFTLVVDDFSIR